jgi:hypothetical protein
MKLITADKARELSNTTAAEMIFELDKLIREAAEKGSREIRVPYKYSTFNGYSAKLKRPEVEEALLAAGYSIYARSEDRQFVDVWIEVSW